MTKTSSENWKRLREIMRLVAIASHQMKHGHTSEIRDAATAHYVELGDELIAILIELEGSGILDRFTEALTATREEAS